jgi:hypothetical protein
LGSIVFILKLKNSRPNTNSKDYDKLPEVIKLYKYNQEEANKQKLVFFINLLA